jgi:hypothetical protein
MMMMEPIGLGSKKGTPNEDNQPSSTLTKNVKIQPNISQSALNNTTDLHLKLGDMSGWDGQSNSNMLSVI